VRRQREHRSDLETRLHCIQRRHIDGMRFRWWLHFLVPRIRTISMLQGREIVERWRERECVCVSMRASHIQHTRTHTCAHHMYTPYTYPVNLISEYPSGKASSFSSISAHTIESTFIDMSTHTHTHTHTHSMRENHTCT
jgi:hypothetical protein